LESHAKFEYRLVCFFCENIEERAYSLSALLRKLIENGTYSLRKFSRLEPESISTIPVDPKFSYGLEKCIGADWPNIQSQDPGQYLCKMNKKRSFA